jgi:4-amino-4-deoxy-L-arabinose transferase-like glycosyltransferase
MAPKPQARATPRSAWVEWLAQYPATLLTLATLAVLLPFIGKPFDIDDPLFVWVAQHIRSHPLDPYGFNVNWYGYEMPLWALTKNPPLAGYYLALVGSVFGWSESVLHTALLLPAVAVVVGAYRLAARFCKHPLAAALLALFTPVFLVSSTTVMCDVTMLAFWVWAVVFWMDGTERKRPGYFAVAALLITLAALTKYFGFCVIPLVALWSLCRKQRLTEWLGWLAIPAAALVAYHFATRALYGRGLLADAGSYATGIHQSYFLAALAFAGGGLAFVTFFAPLLWGRREFLLTLGASLVVATIFLFVLKSPFHAQPNAGQILQVALWVFGAVSLFILTFADLYHRRDADSLMLACWVLGTFAFTAFLNWIVNGRSLLPIAIPAGILVVRRLEQRLSAGVKKFPTLLLAPGIAGALLAIWVAAADYSFALAPKVAARAVHSAYGNDTHRLWFQGHWGFQYYMEKYGASALDLQHLKLTQGDYIAMPSDNSNVYPLKEPVAELKTFSVPISGRLSTMNKETGAGFYASLWGPLPFAFGATPPQIVTVFAYDPSGEIQKTNSSLTGR